MVKDMTEGRPLKLIVAFYLPLLLGNLFQQFYSMVDSIIVGQFVGVNALAGVGSTGSLNFLILGFATGVCGGFSILYGQRFGAKDYSGMRRYILNALYLVIAIAAVLTPVTVLLCRPMLQMLNTPDSVIDYAYSYFVIILGGMFFTMLYNVAASILRSIGDSRTPLVMLILSAFINIALDLALVLWFHMGVRGTAVATIVSQAVSAIASFLYMFKRYRILRPSRKEMAVQLHKVRELLGVGLPMALQFSITAIGSIMLQYAINGLGASAVAAVTAADKIGGICIGIIEMIGMALVTYASQNVGAGRIDRISSGLKAAMGFSYCICAVLMLMAFLFGRQLCTLFVDSQETALLDMAQQYLRINVSFYPVIVLLIVFRYTVQGMGFSTLAMLAGVSELIGRGVAAFGLTAIWGLVGVSLASPLAWILATIILIFCYRYAMRKIHDRVAIMKRVSLEEGEAR